MVSGRCLRIFFALGLFLAKSAHGEPACEYTPNNEEVQDRPGFVEFMAQSRLAPFKHILPYVQNDEVNAAIHGIDTMWYDDQSMVFLYQDSAETVVGARANCVGRKIGEQNADDPAIGKLLNYFGPDFKFKFPFRTVAGTDNVSNILNLNFWVPPKSNQQILPVKYWRSTARGRWHWVFPIGTLIGEVLYQRAPNGTWYAFEIRTRKRYRDGWAVDLFRPYRTATALANAITQKRPDWQNNENLKSVVSHLRNNSNLVPHKMRSEAFGSVFRPIDGALDLIPDIYDKDLVVELLTTSPFISTEGAIWKEKGSLETYGPGSKGEFSIVPKGYEMGMIPVNEVSCNRCHMETGRPLKDFEWDVQAYGELWGEDRIFTWNLFKPNSHIYATFDDEDGSRILNPRLVQAKLVINQKPTANDPFYKQLPVPYDQP